MSIRRTCVSSVVETTTLATLSDAELAQSVGGFWGGYSTGGYRTGAPSGYPSYAPAPTPYTVQRGDNLTNIAKQSGESLGYLLQQNPQYQANPNLIYPGQQVITGTPRYRPY